MGRGVIVGIKKAKDNLSSLINLTTMLASNVVTEIWLNLTATRVLLRHLPYFFFSRVKIINNLSSFKWVTVKSVQI